MRKITTTSRAPFAVSLALIFGYSLLQVVVPPTTFGTQDLDSTIAGPADTLAPAERVLQARSDQASTRDAPHSVQ